MAKFEGFEDIQAWQKAYKISLKIYGVTTDGAFSRDFGLKDQIRREAVSIMANIAEGHDRKRNTEFAHFLNLARGSAHEVQSHLHLASGLNYIAKDEFDNLYNGWSEVSRMTLSLARYLRTSEH